MTRFGAPFAKGRSGRIVVGNAGAGPAENSGQSAGVVIRRVQSPFAGGGIRLWNPVPEIHLAVSRVSFIRIRSGGPSIGFAVTGDEDAPKHVASSVSFRVMARTFAMPAATICVACVDRIGDLVRCAIAGYVNDAPDAGRCRVPSRQRL